MRFSKLSQAGAFILAAVIVTASQGETHQAQASPAPSLCKPNAAEALAGKRRITNAKARRITGASIVRQIRPGQGVTMDYRRERVTIETHPKTRRILRAYCG